MIMMLISTVYGVFIKRIPAVPVSRHWTRLTYQTQTGLEEKAGPIVTAGGLIFIAGAEDKQFRAFEKATGKLLWETTLPAMANATACTYMVKGKQYVALSVGGTKENPSGSTMAFALP
jgi:quinoprotein glucose dehydrogenase